MFSRLPKKPPNTVVASSSAYSSGLPRAMPGRPTITIVCSSPGLGTKSTCCRAATFGAGGTGGRAALPFQSPKCFFASATASSREMSPAITSATVLGPTCCP